jgi:hypothetical protein
MSLVPSVPASATQAALSAEPLSRALTVAAAAGDIEIRTEGDAQSVADMMGMVRRGQKHLDDEYDKIARPVRAGLDAIRALFKPHQASLETAMRVLKAKHSAWAEAERVRAVAERRKLEEAAAKAALRAAEDAAALGAGDEEAPPPAIVTATAPPPITRGVESKAYQRIVPHAEVVNFAEVPQAWVEFRPSLAIAAFREAQKSGQAPSVADGPVVWRGVRFFNTTSTVSA